MNPFSENTIYHIYNHAIGPENLFRRKENYPFFLTKYKLYLAPVAHTLAYCLMPNHFHLLVKVKPLDEIKTFPKFQTLEKLESYSFKNPGKLTKQEKNELTKHRTLLKIMKLETFDPLLVSKLFSNLFSSYTQAYNKAFKRRGSLFLKNFKRKLVDSEGYLRNTVNYIHFNPVHHGFVENPSEWEHSSFNTIVSGHQTFINRAELLYYYDDLANFIYCHRHPVKMKDEF